MDLLRRAGFIVVQRKRTWSCCKRNDKALGECVAWLAEETGAQVGDG